MKAYHIWIDDQIAPDSFGEASVSAKFIRGEVANAKKENAEKLVLHMNTPGGHVFEGFAIFNELTRAGLPVDVYNEGVIASIGTLIMLAGAENTIYMSPASQLMFHKPMVGTQGNSDDHQASVAELKKIEDLMAERYAHKMGKEISEGHALMANGDYWVNPSEAIGLKIIDQIQMPVAAFGKKQEFINQKNNKMKKPNLIAQLFAEISAMVTPVTAGMQKLADGNTTLYYEGDTLETGKAVFTDEAMETKAPVGEHALEDGRIIVVDEAGVIVEIREIEANADDTEALATANARIAELEAELATANAENANLTTAHQTQLTQVNAKLVKLQAAITSSSSGVAGEVIVKPAKESKFVSETRAKVEAARNGKMKL